MIWFSYTDKLYIKMMGYPWDIDWNIHHQHFLFKIQRKQWKWHGCTRNLFWFLLPAQAEPNWAEQLGSSCWRSPRCPVCTIYLPRFVNIVKERPPVQLQKKKEKKDLALNDLRANLFSFFLWLPKGFSLIKLYNLLLAPQKSVKPGLWGSTNGGQWHNYQLGVCNTVLSNMVLKEHSGKSE